MYFIKIKITIVLLFVVIIFFYFTNYCYFTNYYFRGKNLLFWFYFTNYCFSYILLIKLILSKTFPWVANSAMQE